MNTWHEIITDYENEEDMTEDALAELDEAREARAEDIAEALDDAGYHARVWTAGRKVRVYVTRELSRRRNQDIGYIGIALRGQAICHLDRNAAGICDTIGLCR